MLMVIIYGCEKRKIYKVMITLSARIGMIKDNIIWWETETEGPIGGHETIY